MTIQECEIGMLVYKRDIDMGSPNFDKPEFRLEVNRDAYSRILSKNRYLLIGHIVDLALSLYNDTFVVVKWNDGEQGGIHPSNLIAVKSYNGVPVDGSKE